METDAYIAIGSNLGDRELNLLKAVAELGRLEGCRVTAVSRFFETFPVGMQKDTPFFYNGVVRIATTCFPHDLLHKLKRIERDVFGRELNVRLQSRYIDLDILLYGDIQLVTPDLILPHPLMTTRCFVLKPLADIAPDLREPVSKLTVTELLGRLSNDEQVRPLE